jgi:hypothetical protein
LNITTTSRAEGAHHRLKINLSSANKTILQVILCIQRLLNIQYDFIKHELIKSSLSQTISWGDEDFFKEIKGKVTKCCLLMLWNQYLKATTGNHFSICSRCYEQSMGIPCCHHIKRMFEKNQNLQLFNISAFWYTQPILSNISNINAPTLSALNDSELDNQLDEKENIPNLKNLKFFKKYKGKGRLEKGTHVFVNEVKKKKKNKKIFIFLFFLI